MAPICSSVASVRVHNPNHRSSTAPSASVVTNVSTHSLPDDIGHGHGTLTEVPTPTPPHPKPPVAAPSPPPPRTPGQGRSHVVDSVAPVPVRIDEAAANIEKMRTFARGLLHKWPLDGLFGWLDGGKETGSGQPALDTKPVPSAVHEETFTDAPPPYSPK